MSSGTPRRTSTQRTGLGARVYELREERGLTQTDLALEVGIKRPTVAAIETGKDLPGRETLKAIADVFGVSTDFLLRGTSGPARTPQAGELVYDADELAWLQFWRGLDDADRLAVLRMLKVNAPKAAAG